MRTLGTQFFQPLACILHVSFSNSRLAVPALGPASYALEPVHRNKVFVVVPWHAVTFLSSDQDQFTFQACRKFFLIAGHLSQPLPTPQAPALFLNVAFTSFASQWTGHSGGRNCASCLDHHVSCLQYCIWHGISVQRLFLLNE